MATTSNDGSGFQYVSGSNSWATTANAYDGNTATVTSLTTTTTGAHVFDVTGYAFGDVIASTDVLDSLTVTVYQYVSNAARWNNPTVQAYDGATAIGTATTIAESTSSTNSSVVTLSSVTLAQLRSANFKIRFTANKNGTQSATQNFGAAVVAATYSPPVETKTGSVTGSSSTSGTVAGRSGRRGTTTGSASTSGTATGTAKRSGSASTQTTATGSVSGSTARLGTVSASTTSTGTVNARTARTGTANASTTVTGSIDGNADRAGTVSAATTSSGSVDGATARAGSGSGASTVTGSASGVVGYDLDVSGSVTGTQSTTGTVAGSTGRRGATTGTTEPTGSSAGRVGYLGTVTGATTMTGTVSGVSDGPDETTGGSGGARPVYLAVPPFPAPIRPFQTPRGSVREYAFSGGSATGRAARRGGCSATSRLLGHAAGVREQARGDRHARDDLDLITLELVG